MRGRSLALRLAVLLAGVLVIVLVVAGIAVNRAASRSLDETLGPREEARLNLAVAVIEQGLARGIDQRALQRLIGQVAGQTGGVATLVDEDGSVLASAGRLPADIETQKLTTPLSTATGGGALELEVPSPGAPFIRAFNATLLLTGVIAVAAMLLAAAFVASRLTRPLRAVAEAARRLGEGDLAARASGGSDAESAELAAAFNGMADRLQRSEVLRRRAASDLAHDLATPATVLESQLQAMVDGVVPADAAQLETARFAAASLSRVIGELGELTQAEAAPLQRRSESVDLLELANEVMAALEGLARERGVAATVIGEHVMTHCDRGQLTRALRNVVTNAVQHTPTGGTVRVEVTGRPAPLVRVIDTGPGIAGEDLPHVFERFYRADASRSPGSGHGIGLTVARELVAANGGRIEVESTGLAGTTFRIELPGA